MSKTLNCVQTVNNKRSFIVSHCKTIRYIKATCIRHYIIFQASNAHGCMKVRRIKVNKKDTKKIFSPEIKELKTSVKNRKIPNMKMFSFQEERLKQVTKFKKEVDLEEKRSNQIRAIDSEKQKGILIDIDEDQICFHLCETAAAVLADCAL